MVRTEKSYAQPSFFQFGSDSIRLVEKIVYDYGDKRELRRVADFCAGCGVIGIELFCSNLIIERVDFYERNIGYRPFIKTNLEMFYSNYKQRFPNYENVHFQDIKMIKDSFFDLIVCNPPYFYKIKNRVSKNKDRLSSRFFIDLTFLEFIKEISAHLNQNGRSYILYRSEEIKKEREEIDSFLFEIGRTCIWQDKFFQKTGLLVIS